jgi:Asp-tRNA(Asn)/Glu-tRNA(Gln) amidotransferase B subunit
MPRRKPEEIRIVNHLEVNDAVEEVLNENTGLLLDVQRNMPYAINKLVSEVMRRTTVKVDPKKVRQLILSKM